MKFRVKPSSPLIVDRWIDVVYAALWALYAVWGLITMFSGLPTLDRLAPPWYPTLWAGAVGSLSAIAAICSISLFFDTKLSFITKKKVERAAVIALGAFITLYPVLLILAVFGGDSSRFSVAALSLTYLLFPGYRIYLLNQRIKAYELANEEVKAEGLSQ